MKKLLTFLLVSFLVTTKLLAGAITIPETSGRTGAQISTDITNAVTGGNTDITIQLDNAGTYGTSSSGQTIAVTAGVTSLKIYAPSGVMPTFYTQGFITLADGGVMTRLTIDGVKIVTVGTSKVMVACSSTTYPLGITIQNSYINGMRYVLRASTSPTVEFTNGIIINNNIFNGIYQIITGFSNVINTQTYTNNTFIETNSGTVIDYRTALNSGMNFTFSKNTIYSSGATNFGTNGLIRLAGNPTSGSYTIDKNLIASGSTQTYTYGNYGYVYSNLNFSTSYTTSNITYTNYPFTNILPYTNAIATLFPNAASNDFTIGDSSFPGKISVGDPRWYYPETVLLNGGASNATLSALSYLEGSGPSTSTSFTIQAYVPRSVITLTAPTNFEISTSASSGYTGTLTLGTANTDLASTTIYVRLQSGLTHANSPFSGNITVTTTTGTSKTVACSGTVSAVALTPLSTPTNLIASAPVYTGGFHASWTAVSNASSYTVKIYGTPSPTLTAITGTSTDITGLTQGSAYTFTVTAIGDGTTFSNSLESSPSGSVTIPVQPTVSSVTPASGATIPVSGTISVVFSENVTRNSANDITLGGATISESNISISGSTVTITYSGLSYNNNSCGLTIPAGAFKSSATGSPTAVATTPTYETPDNIPPTLTKMSISNGAILPVNGFISLVMSEPCQAGSATVTIGSNTITPSISTSNSNLVYINYSGLAYNTDYTLTIPANSITDLSGNSYAGTTVTFHTVMDAKGTQLFSFTPDATSVPSTSSGTVTATTNGYTISFASVQNAGARSSSPYTYAFKTNSVTLPTLPSVGELSFYVQCGGGSVPQEYDIQKSTDNGQTWNTIETFLIGTNDVKLITTGAAQSSGSTTLRLMYNSSNLWFYNVSASGYTLNDDGLPPSVTLNVPAATASNASINDNIKLIYSKSVVPGTGNITLNGVTLTPVMQGTNVILPYTNLNYSTTYTLNVPAGAFVDLFSRPCAAFTLTFTTMSRPAVTKKGFDFVVGVDGDFSAAIAAATAAQSSGNRFRIFFPNGQYNIGGLTTADANQMTTIALPNVSYIGQSGSGVSLYNLPTTEGIGTTATIHLTGAAGNIYMQDLTLSNNYPYTGSTGRAVALWDQGTKNIYKNVTLLSYQDTYYSGNGRMYFEGGSIHGVVDFLCGDGDVFFNGTQLYLENRTGDVIAAPATSTSYGYVFSGCTIDGSSNANGNFYLGRPWQNSPKAVYINTKMDILPSAIGWTTMGAVVQNQFAEYNSSTSLGTSVDVSSRMTTYTYNSVSTPVNPVLTATQAVTYTVNNVLGGSDTWQPQLSTDQAAVPVITGNGNTLSWPDNNYVSCWGIFKDGVFVTFVTTNSYTVPLSVTSGAYTVRAANEMGGLSAVSNSCAYPFSLATDNFRSNASGNSADLTTWASSSDNINWIQATALPTAAATSVTIQNGHTINVNSNLILSTLTLNSGSTLNVNAAIQLTVSNSLTNNGTLNLLSGTNGTATILTPATISGSGTATVQQYMTTGRNWYISSPVASAATSIVTGNSAGSLWSYDEPSTSWLTIDATHNDVSFVPTKGYVANMASGGPVTFTGGALNNGTITSPTLTSSATTKTGFNLVGNPYPSYLNWLSVLASTYTSNMEPTMWYRTRSSSAYVFDTFNATAGIGTNNNGYAAVTGQIAPMQAFWVRAVAGQTGTLVFDNTMRSHQDQSITTNSLKAPAVAKTTQQVLRLQVSNAVNSDEAVVLFNPNASDGFDDYDSEKMSNNSAAIPEIYTLAGTQQVAINGLNSVATNPVLPLGFTTGASNTFTIKATEVTNFDAGTQIVLKDNLLNTEQDLTDGTSYTFTSDVASTTSRFSVVFKSVAVNTGVQAASGDQSILIYKNANNQITVNYTGPISDNGYVSVYNALGQKLELKKMTGTTTIIDKAFTSGVYVVTVNNGGTCTTKKVILN